jgi:HlyD family secretion protein
VAPLRGGAAAAAGARGRCRGLTFPPELTSLTDRDFQAFLANQRAQFAVQRQGLSERQAILGRRIGQLDQEVAAVERENEGLREQLDIVSEEMADKAQLLEQNLIRKPELLALRRLSLAAQGPDRLQRGHHCARRPEGRGDRAADPVAQDRLPGFKLARDLVRVNSELAQLEESMTSSRDVFRRTEIFAPVSGRVHNLRAETIGGIVRPGEKILDIVPEEDALVIEARLSPNDIDVVAVGQIARVHLTPYSARTMAPLEGHLVRISPDAKVDEATRETYYEVRIEVDPDMLERMATKVEMTPGMPAEVFILTGEQSLFSYMAAPVTSSFRKGLPRGLRGRGPGICQVTRRCWRLRRIDMATPLQALTTPRRNKLLAFLDVRISTRWSPPCSSSRSTSSSSCTTTARASPTSIFRSPASSPSCAP